MPEIAREAGEILAVAQGADAAQRRVVGHELASGLLQQRLFFGEDQFHGGDPEAATQSGSPNTRLAMMLSWISDVPPSIELPRERSQSRVNVSSCSLNPGPSHPKACGPAIAIMSSRRRMFSSVP